MVLLAINGTKVFFQQEIEKRIQASTEKENNLSKAWRQIPEKLAFYDYIGV
jgi:photosystem II CP47 chlorophyll apoprotein